MTGRVLDRLAALEDALTEMSARVDEFESERRCRRCTEPPPPPPRWPGDPHARASGAPHTCGRWGWSA